MRGYVVKSVDRQGTLASGSRYRIQVPENWNDVLLLSQRPLPVGAQDPPWSEDEPLLAAMLAQGYALGGSANTIFWPLAQAFPDQIHLIDTFEQLVGRPAFTIAWGPSIGGIMSAGLVQLSAERLSGALPLCGNLAGAVAVHNRELDIAFVLKTLLASSSPLQLIDITEPGENMELADAVLAQAAESPEGRARISLAAAVGNIPGWFDPSTPEPAPDDFMTREDNQFKWIKEIGVLVFFWAREQVERQAGGNPSWNTAVDYGQLLANSIDRDEVERLYQQTGLDLDRDLDVLAAETRIDADPAAVAYLERNIVFSGDLGGVPVLTLHTDGDGLVTPDNEHAYSDVVTWAGQHDFLRQLYVHRAGHCTFTLAEVLTGLQALMERVTTDAWPMLDSEALNASASALGPDFNSLVMQPIEEFTPLAEPTEPRFFSFTPPSFPRAYDVRSPRPD